MALLPGRFWGGDGLGPRNEHLVLRVRLDGASWLVDVVAGYSFLVPLRLGGTRVDETLEAEALDGALARWFWIPTAAA